MEIVRRLTDVTPDQPVVATIGNFDGVHWGHQQLIARVRQRAAERSAKAALITFDPHPSLVLRPGQSFPQLICFSDKVKLIGRLGLDRLVIITFTPQVAAQSPDEFLTMLCRHLNVTLLVEGDDFALGKGRAGTTAVIAEIGARLGFELEIMARLQRDGLEVSSAAVREALATGAVSRAATLLGRPAAASGPVVEGARRGRTIGYPTANIAVSDGLALPMNGVYTAVITSPELPQAVRAMVNIGTRPTFVRGDHGARTIEAHLLDFDGDLYGTLLTVHFIDRLRDERRFDGVAALVEQLGRDRAATVEQLTDAVVAAATRPVGP